MRITPNNILFLYLLALLALAKTQYRVANETINSTTVALELEYTGPDQHYLKPTSPVCKKLVFVFRTLAFSDFTFKIIDAAKTRFEVPQAGIFPTDPLENFSFPTAASAVSIDYSTDPFDFTITRKENKAVLFSTKNQDLIFSDHYLQIGTEIDSAYLYGIGERFHETFRKQDGKWTIFNCDKGHTIDKGKGIQTYGFYPFYLLRENSNYFHVNYLRNSNAMDIIKSSNSSSNYLTFKIIGGVFDFRFLLGEQNAQTTILKLNKYMGSSAIPPFWSLGYQQSRWGYKNITYLEQVLQNFEKYGLPIDTIWSDIDYMLDFQDFTIDTARFPLDRMKKIMEKVRWSCLIDLGIMAEGDTYEQGFRRGVYVMDADGKGPHFGEVWPGKTTFVDFFHPNASQYWQDMLDKLYKVIKFDGVLLDMNEPSNFCEGACYPPAERTAFDYSRDLPYVPGNQSLEIHTISLNSTHIGNISEADVHAYGGFLQTHATNQFFKSKKVRPFIISRSTTFGSHKYGFHWTGDNDASWPFLRSSIADNFNNQMFGFQMIGPVICGFRSNTTEELCSRWFQLAALYPLAYSHNDNETILQEPYALGPVVLNAAKTGLKLRYSLLKYFYTLFVKNRGLGTLWRPLFFQYPSDDNTYIDNIADTQFFIGSDLLAAPVVEEGVKQRSVYFPKDSESKWFSLFSQKTGYQSGIQKVSNIMTDRVPLFIRPGSIVALQNTESVVNTKQLDNKFQLVASLVRDQKRSNQTFSYFNATGSLLSIEDYNSDEAVDTCLRGGCLYEMTLVLNWEPTGKSVDLFVKYKGEVGLNQRILVTDLSLKYLSDAQARASIQTAVEITGDKSVHLPICEGLGQGLSLQAE